MTAPAWTPKYALTPVILQGLMQIKAACALVDHTPLTPAAEAELRSLARVRAAHFSTFIEGNRLSLDEAERVIDDESSNIQGREGDVGEVRSYWHALLRVEEWAEKRKPLTEDMICRLHGLVEHGPKARSSPYRDGQNAIRASSTGRLVYLPPEAKDVPGLMASMVKWAGKAEADGLPAPLIAGLIHYQFVTIHPYYDGNGRTARLLATLILHRGGFGLNGFFSLEEHYARDLQGYYRALSTHPHHNYYFGRSEADLTSWLEYFIRTLVEVFEAARLQALKCAEQKVPAEPEELRRLDHRARRILWLFATKENITSADVAVELALSERMARNLLRAWVDEGWLEVANFSRRARSYRLSAIYRQYIGSLSATPRGGDENGV
ncbi:MAG: Fic family protein [Methanotrichaceae archaeon]|nr:Fic family protein [Methanotrichaceae archaeon]